MKLKNQIEMYLKANKKRAYVLADEAGVSRSLIYEFLRGKRDIKLSVAEKIKDFIER